MVSVTKKLGLIVNPVAGIGGSVGLKGSDGLETQEKARQLGAIPQAFNRTVLALEAILPLKNRIELITYPDEMGENVTRSCGFDPVVIGSTLPGKTTPADTQAAALEMLEYSVDLLLFAGGDGTARDICSVVGEELPVLGIPAGVKIHSAVFGANPRNAGELAIQYLERKTQDLREAEVVDIDEDAFRQGRITSRLYGYLKIPYRRSLVQSLKTASSPTPSTSLREIAAYVAGQIEPACLYILGPGTTLRAIADFLQVKKTLIGVDVLLNGKIIASDVNEAHLLQLLEGQKARIIVTPIGGQGFIFGRGNQQISPKVIQRVGCDNLILVSTPEKIQSLKGRPLWVDTGDRSVDLSLAGYRCVITGYKESIIYKVTC
jgi:predicted polyphosphate/ATP-dependent NAD kinase